MRNAHKKEYLPSGKIRIFVFDTMSGKTNHVDVESLDYIKWINGAYVQDAFPYLDPDIREILVSGHSAESWGVLFPNTGKEAL